MTENNMTTVINFNFLNFFKLKLDNRSVNINDIRSYNQYVDNRRQDYSSEQEEIVDVTPYSAEEIGQKNRAAGMMIDTHRIPSALNVWGTQGTYDRKGRNIQHFQEKGVLFNSYV